MNTYGTFSLAGPSRVDPWYVKNQNPFAPKTTLIGSPPTQVAPDFGSLLKAIDWENTQVNRANVPSTFTLSGGGGMSPFGGTQTNVNPFTTLRNVKNPDMQSAIDAILGQVKNLSSDPRVNENVVKANVKDPALANRISGAGARFDADVNNSRQSFSEFVKNYMAGQADAQKLYDQESGAIGEVYGKGPSGLGSQLKALSDARKLAVTTAAQRAIGTSLARNNASRMLGGDSSYLDALLADSVGGIGADAAREKADLDRANLLAVKDAQARLLGSRGNLLDKLLTRPLLPIEAGQRLAGNELAQLGTLGNLSNLNTFFQLDSPDQLLARRLGLLGDVGRLDLANNFYGLKKPYEGSTSGLLPVPTGFPSSGGGFNFPNLDLFSGGNAYSPGLPTTRSSSNPNLQPRDSAAREIYYRQSGVYPDQDPNFSPELWQFSLSQLGSTTRPAAPSPVDYSNPYEFPEYNQDAVNQLLSRYYEFPELFSN